MQDRGGSIAYRVGEGYIDQRNLDRLGEGGKKPCHLLGAGRKGMITAYLWHQTWSGTFPYELVTVLVFALHPECLHQSLVD